MRRRIKFSLWFPFLSRPCPLRRRKGSSDFHRPRDAANAQLFQNQDRRVGNNQIPIDYFCCSIRNSHREHIVHIKDVQGEKSSPAPYHVRLLLRRRRCPQQRRTISKYTLSPALFAPYRYHDRYHDGEPPQMGNPLRAPRHAEPHQSCCRGSRASRASLDDACNAPHDPHKVPEPPGWQIAYPCESLRFRR